MGASSRPECDGAGYRAGQSPEAARPPPQAIAEQACQRPRHAEIFDPEHKRDAKIEDQAYCSAQSPSAIRNRSRPGSASSASEKAPISRSQCRRSRRPRRPPARQTPWPMHAGQRHAHGKAKRCRRKPCLHGTAEMIIAETVCRTWPLQGKAQILFERIGPPPQAARAQRHKRQQERQSQPLPWRKRPPQTRSCGRQGGWHG